MPEKIIEFMGLGFLGGAARVLLGVESRFAWKREALLILSVSLPVGVLAGLGVEEVTTSQWLPYIAVYTASVSSLNIARMMLGLDLRAVADKLIRGWTGGN